MDLKNYYLAAALLIISVVFLGGCTQNEDAKYVTIVEVADEPKAEAQEQLSNISISNNLPPQQEKQLKNPLENKASPKKFRH